MGNRYDMTTERGRSDFLRAASMMQLAGKRPYGELLEESKTDRQRRYQFGWLYPQACLALAEAGIGIPLKTGGSYPYDVDILHEVLKKNVAKSLLLEIGRIKHMETPDGREIPQKISTEDLPKKDFCTYVERSRAWMFDLWGIVVPEPQDGYYAQFEREMRRAA